MRHAIGIDVGGTTLKAGVVSADGCILGETEAPLDRGNCADTILQQIKFACDHLLADAKQTTIVGVGIGISACVVPDMGVVTLSAKIPELNGCPLRARLTDEIGLPVFVDNSTNNAGRAEQVFGAAKDIKNFVLVTIGTGIGGAIFANGKLVAGKNGFAGEIGHMSIVPDGRRCRCGGVGCWEAYGSVVALRDDALRVVRQYKGPPSDEQKEIAFEQIISNATHGDVTAMCLVGQWARMNAIGIGNLINILNCEVCVVGGGASCAGQFLIDQIAGHAREFVLPCSWSSCRIVLAKFRNKSGVIGSATLALAETHNLL